MNDLKLTILVVKTQVLICQCPNEAIENCNLVTFHKAPIESLTCALSSKDYFCYIGTPCLWFERHLFNNGSCAFTSFKFYSTSEFFSFFLFPIGILLLFCFTALFDTLLVSLNLFEIVLHLSLFVLALLAITKHGVGVVLPPRCRY